MFYDNKDFYPTKKETAYKLFDMFYNENKNSFRKCTSILEPSAGKGDLIESFYQFLTDKDIEIYKSINKKITDIKRQKYYNEEKLLQENKKEYNIDVIEIDETLQNILRGKNLNVVGTDFLQFSPPKFYDLIIANVPFSNGCSHLLKMINIQERIGGKILCIINAETVRNIYSKERKLLSEKLEKYNAKIEFFQDEFIDAERKTNVEIAMVYIDVPMKNDTSLFEKEFKKLNDEKINVNDINSVTKRMNKLESLCLEFKCCRDSIIKLYEEKIRIEKLFNGLGINQELGIVDSKELTRKPLDVNEFIQKINLDYWKKLIVETDLRKKLPSKLRDTFDFGIERQKDIEFNIDNVRYFYESLMMAIPKNYEETVADVFKKCTYEHCYSDSVWNKNIHMYSGWKTNCAYMIKEKCIIPFYNDSYLYNIPDVLQDLNVIFNNISASKIDINTQENIEKIKHYEKNIDVGHFILDSYKKGTIHIKFKNKDHLRIFNIIAGKGSNALPNDFGRKSYKDMTEKEKELVKVFFDEPIEYSEFVLKGNNKYIPLQLN